MTAAGSVYRVLRKSASRIGTEPKMDQRSDGQRAAIAVWEGICTRERRLAVLAPRELASSRPALVRMRGYRATRSPNGAALLRAVEGTEPALFTIDVLGCRLAQFRVGARRHAGVRGSAFRRVEVPSGGRPDSRSDGKRPGAAEAARRIGPALVRGDRITSDHEQNQQDTCDRARNRRMLGSSGWSGRRSETKEATTEQRSEPATSSRA
jgi:hypothetical protein